MRAKKILSTALVMALLASVVPVVITPAAAQQAGIPCDDGDNELTKGELANAILPYMLDESDFKLDDVGDAAYVYAYWTGKPKTIVDDADREVTIYRPAERILPISSLVTEIMRSLKATDKIVGVMKGVVAEKVFFQELSDLPNIGGGPGGIYDYEKIAELQPELVFLYPGSGYDQYADRIKSTIPGVTMVRVGAFTVQSDVYIQDVNKIGDILDREYEAEELLDFQEECLNQIKEKVETLSESEKPKVFYTYPSYLPTTYYTANRFSHAHESIVEAGGINIAADLGGYRPGSGTSTTNPEWVALQNPEFIIGRASIIGYKKDKPTEAEMEAMRDKIMLQPGWEGIPAVNNDTAYLISSRVFSNPQSFICTAYMAKLFHPELFKDLDPRAIHQEYLRFQGLDFDVYEDGVFVYPELKVEK